MSTVKVGLDDFIAAGHGVDHLLALAVDRLPAPPEDPFDEDSEYFTNSDGIFRRKAADGGSVTLQLTNFGASIVGDVREDDGVEVHRLFELEATLANRRVTIRIPSAQFPLLNWAPEHLGARAIVFPGSATRDHARVAIQILSGEPLEKTIYTHLGWRQTDRGWMYLHAEGAVGAGGQVTDVSVAPPDSLARYVLPSPPSGDRLVAAVRSSMKFLDLAPRRITLPLHAAIFRAPLGRNDFSIHASGETGTYKTALATLAQQHYGSGMNVDHLPGSWSSTGNALEVLAFAAKDALFVIDDFVPRGGSQEVARLHREADRILRAQGNASGRQRLRPDTTLRPVKRPRGLILSTGEDIPLGHSLRARLLIVEFNAGDVDLKRLTSAQEDAAAGTYAECLSGYLAWLAPRYGEIRDTLAGELGALRALVARKGLHPRTPTTIASTSLGLKYFLEFAVDVGALSRAEADDEWNQSWEEFIRIGIGQKKFHDATEPTLRFRELLSAAIASGQAHVAALDGSAPAHPESWGWRRSEGTLASTGTWLPGGARIGWLGADNDLYLEPDASFAAAQEMARSAGETITIAGKTLHKRLADRSLLRSTERGARGTLAVRKMVQGERHPVLHVHAATFLFAGPDQSDHDDEKGPEDAQDSWSVPGATPAGPDQETDHDTRSRSTTAARELGAAGPVGQFGQVIGRDRRRPQDDDAHTERFEA